jgi:hypothetical protein
VLGGFLQVHYGVTVLFAVLAAMVLLWWGLAARMPDPPFLTSVMLRLETMSMPALSGLKQQLQQVDGVKEAVVLPEDAVAYLRVDPERVSTGAVAGPAGGAGGLIRIGKVVHEQQSIALWSLRTASGRVSGSYGPSPLGWWEWKQHT